MNFARIILFIGAAVFLNGCSILPSLKMDPNQSGGFNALLYEGENLPDTEIYILTLPKYVYIKSITGKNYKIDHSKSPSKIFFKKGEYNIVFSYYKSIPSGYYKRIKSADDLKLTVYAKAGRTGSFRYEFRSGQIQYGIDDTTIHSTLEKIIDTEIVVDKAGRSEDEIKKLADNGDVDSQLLYGTMRLKGVGALILIDDGIKYLEMASSNNSSDADYLLANEYAFGSWYLKQDFKKALHYWRKAANNNHIPSQYALSVFGIIVTGLGKNFDEEKLKKLFLIYKDISGKYLHASSVKNHVESFLRLLEKEGRIKYDGFEH